MFAHLVPRFLSAAVVVAAVAIAAGCGQAPPETSMVSRFAADVDQELPWPEYPRPQLVRSRWLNLNGQWDYALSERGAAQPATFDGQILVPFAIESTLSGVGQAPTDRANALVQALVRGARRVERRTRVAALRRGRLSRLRVCQRPARGRAQGRLHAVQLRCHRLAGRCRTAGAGRVGLGSHGHLDAGAWQAGARAERDLVHLRDRNLANRLARARAKRRLDRRAGC